jgi:hypothetical protein
MDGKPFCNTMTFDVEGPIRYPDDLEGKKASQFLINKNYKLCV